VSTRKVPYEYQVSLSHLFAGRPSIFSSTGAASAEAGEMAALGSHVRIMAATRPRVRVVALSIEVS
jgi:hypothetical protein